MNSGPLSKHATSGRPRPEPGGGGQRPLKAGVQPSFTRDTTGGYGPLVWLISKSHQMTELGSEGSCTAVGRVTHDNGLHTQLLEVMSCNISYSNKLTVLGKEGSQILKNISAGRYLSCVRPPI